MKCLPSTRTLVVLFHFLLIPLVTKANDYVAVNGGTVGFFDNLGEAESAMRGGTPVGRKNLVLQSTSFVIGNAGPLTMLYYYVPGSPMSFGPWLYMAYGTNSSPFTLGSEDEALASVLAFGLQQNAGTYQ